MDYQKKRQSKEAYLQNEMTYNLHAAFVGGVLASIATNPLECITVNKQINKNLKLREFIKSEGLWSICTKGLIPRTIHTGS
jgi:hypothetical protein